MAGHWSASFSRTVHEVAGTINSVGEFEYGLSRADYSSDIDVVSGGERGPVAKLRFSPFGLGLDVRHENWVRVVGVPVHASTFRWIYRTVREAVEPFG